MIVGAGTEALAAEGCIVTAGGIDSHIHFICPQQIDEAHACGAGETRTDAWATIVLLQEKGGYFLKILPH